MGCLNDIRVRRDKARGKWVVDCVMCKPGLFGGVMTIFSAIAEGPDFGIAVDWAYAHAQRHERSRCRTCGHLPTGALPLHTKANEEASA